VFVGLVKLTEAVLGSPQWWSGLQKKARTKVTAVELLGDATGVVLGYLFFGPWGIAIGMVLAGFITIVYTRTHF
jgi:hypothetical protein